jgi:hypothetical protein
MRELRALRRGGTQSLRVQRGGLRCGGLPLRPPGFARQCKPLLRARRDAEGRYEQRVRVVPERRTAPFALESPAGTGTGDRVPLPGGRSGRSRHLRTLARRGRRLHAARLCGGALDVALRCSAGISAAASCPREPTRLVRSFRGRRDRGLRRERGDYPLERLGPVKALSRDHGRDDRGHGGRRGHGRGHGGRAPTAGRLARSRTRARAFSEGSRRRACRARGRLRWVPPAP